MVMMKHSGRQFDYYFFEDLVAKVKNLVALAPVLGAILRPGYPPQFSPTCHFRIGSCLLKCHFIVTSSFAVE